MTTIESLMEDYQERTEKLHEEQHKLRWEHGEYIRRLIYVRAVDNVQRIPFTVCPGEKRVRIDVNEICKDYAVCDRTTGQALEGWSITLT